MARFFEELKKRHVIRVAIAYLVTGWLVLQLADVLFPALGLPEWAISLALGLLALGFPVAMVLAWVFDFTTDGLKRTGKEDSFGEGEKTPAIEEISPVVEEKSIAVLPFPDFSAEQDQEHFCDGLTEELLNVLTSIPGLQVASRTSCFAFKSKQVDLREVASKLQVAHILEGSVRKAGNTIRITAQLIEASSDSHLWSETYDRQLDDIFAIQDDIAARIRDVLHLKLGGDARTDPTTTNVKAYEFYLRGRGYAITRIDDDHPRAITMFQKAVELDPEFVRAWIGLADICSSQALYHGGGEDARRLSSDAAQHAMQLAPERSASHLASGFSNLAQRDYKEAERDFLKAVEINPNEISAWHFAGRAAHFQGDPRKSRIYFMKATELDPDDWESPLLALQGYQAEGNEEGSRRVAEIGLERVKRYQEDYPDNPRSWYLATTAWLAINDAKTGAEWAERALTLSENDSSTRYNVACFFSMAGDHERALDLLENSITSRSWIENDSELEPLRKYPRYKAIIESCPD